MKKFLAVLLAVVMITAQIPLIAYADGEKKVDFSFKSDVDAERVEQGDEITFTVGTGETNDGYAVGAWAFDVSDTLELVEAYDLLEDDTFTIERAVEGENKGKYVYTIMRSSDYKKANKDLITLKFRVKADAVGEAYVEMISNESGKILNIDGDPLEVNISGKGTACKISYLINGTDFTVASDKGEYVLRGEEVTYSVKTGEINKGFMKGKLCFAASSNLSLVADQAGITTETVDTVEGVAVYSINLQEANTATKADVCSVKFKVADDASGDVSVKFFTKELVNTVETVDKAVSAIVNGKPLEDTLTSKVYIAVSDIADVPNETDERVDLPLTSTVTPDNAAEKTVVWTIKDAGDTGASLEGNVLKTAKMGTVVLTATIKNGASATTDFTKEFTVTVKMDPTFVSAKGQLDTFSLTDISDTVANSSDDVKTYIENQAKAVLDTYGVETTVTIDDFTAAEDGAPKTTSAGTSGSVEYSIKISKDTNEYTVSELSFNITPVAYTGVMNSDVKAELDAVVGAIDSTELDETYNTQVSAEEKLKDDVEKALAKAISENPDYAAKAVPAYTISVITAEDGFVAAVAGSAATTKEGTKGSETFTVQIYFTADDDSYTTEEATVDIKAVAYTGKLNSEVADEAALAVESATFEDMPQEEITEEKIIAALKSTAEKAIANETVVVEIIKISYDEAEAGTSAKPEGTDGTYAFKVKVTKENKSAETSETSILILATAFDGTSDVDAVNNAKNGITGGNVDVDFPGDAAQKIDAVEKYVNAELKKIEHTPDVTAEVVLKSDKTYTVTFHKGVESASADIEMTFDVAPDPDIAIVEAAQLAINSHVWESIAQVDAETSVAAAATVKAIAEEVIDNPDVEVTVNVSAFTAAIMSTGESADHDGTNGSVTFTVHVKKGNQELDADADTVEITATYFDGLIAKELIDLISETLGKIEYTNISQANAETEVKALEAVIAQAGAAITTAINGKEHAEYILQTKDVTFDPATAGSAATTHEGSNGSVKFKISAQCASQNCEIPEATVTIVATAFTGMLDSEAVESAKSAIESASYSIKQTAASDADGFLAKLKTKMETTVSDYGVTLELTKTSYTAAVAGTAATTHDGTNGQIKASVKITKNAEIDNVAEKAATITATKFEGLLDSEAVASAIDAIKDFEIEVENGTSDEDIKEMVFDYVKDLIPKDIGDVKLTLENVVESAYTFKVAKNAANDTKTINVDVKVRSNAADILRQIMLYYQSSQSKKFHITAKAGIGGTITNEGNFDVKFGRDVTFEIIPDEGYRIKDVLVNGKSVGATSIVNVPEVRKDLRIVAEFELIPEEVVPEWTNPFTDISESDPFFEAVKFVNEAGLFLGTSDTTFSPNNTMTRAMFVTVLGRLAKVDVSEYQDTSFTDVESGLWYSEYVEWAAKNNIVNGYGDGNFGPNNQVTIQQAVVILARYAEFIGKDLSADVDLNQFVDSEDVADWASSQMKWAIANGIYIGNEGKLNPKELASRSLVAEMVYALDQECTEE